MFKKRCRGGAILALRTSMWGWGILGKLTSAHEILLSGWLSYRVYAGATRLAVLFVQGIVPVAQQQESNQYWFHFWVTYSIRGCATPKNWCNTSRPPLYFNQTPLFLLSREYHRPTLLSNLLFNWASNKESKMSQYTNNSNNFPNTTNSYNTNSYNTNVRNYYTIADDRLQLLTWLSPLEPSLRHQDIRERRVNHVGEWLIEAEEFRKWCGLSGEGEDCSAVLYCYGHPGVGKTFIR